MLCQKALPEAQKVSADYAVDFSCAGEYTKERNELFHRRWGQ